MNKRLLFMSISMLLSLTAMAQWTLPVPQQFEKLSVEYAESNAGLAANVNTSVEPSTYYYLYNKQSGLFMRQGNSWETQASVGADPLKVYFVSEIEGDDTEVLIKLWATDRSTFAWRTLFIDSPNSCFVDHASQSNYYWYWDDLGDNTYRFYGSAMNPDYNAEFYPDRYFGYDLHGGSSFTGALNSMLDINNVPEGHTYCVEWQLVSEEEYQKIKEQYEVALPRAEFQNRLNYAKSLGNINTERYAAYTQSDATTTAELDSLRTILNSAISLKERVNAAAELSPAINLQRFAAYYGSAESTVAEMDSVRALISPAMTLSNYLNDIIENYPSISVTAAESLLAKADWTTTEIDDMTKDLKTQARRLDVAVYLDGATEDDPRDGTMLLENPRFDTGNINGWTVTIQGQNIGYQELSGNFSDVTLPDGSVVRGYQNTDRNGYYSWLYKFIESWAPSATLPDGTIHQVIAGLPAGKYTFSCDAIATYQPDANRQPQGVYLFARSGQYEFREPIFSGNEKPEHFELTFISVNDTITFGLLAEGANTNWLAADNFEITYYGPVEDNPYKIALDALIATTTDKYPMLEDIMANADAKEGYQTALDDAMTASETGSEDADYLTAIDLLNAAVDVLAASIKDYELVQQALLRCETEQIRFEGTTFEGLGNQFEDLKMILDDGYNNGNAEEAIATFELGDGTYNTTIAELSDFMDKMIVDYITANVQAGDEITLLINNPDFETGFSGWTVSGATPAWGGLNSTDSGQGVNTVEEFADMELRGGGNAEVYQRAFDMSQVVYNLPKGSYTLTAQAFERNEDGYLAQWAQGPEVGISAELYCNDFVKKVHNVMAGSQPTKVYGNGAWSDDRNDDGQFQPNCMTGANFYFNLGEDRKLYENEINFVLTNDGDPITIGLRTTSTRGWVIFDNFRLIYNGTGKPIYAPTVDDLKEQLAAIADDETYAGSDAKTLALKAIDDLTDVMADNSKGDDDVIEAIANANEVLKYGKESINLYTQLNDAVGALGENFDAAAQYLTNEMFDEANTLYEDALNVYVEGSKDNDGVKTLIEQVNETSNYLAEAATLREDLFEAEAYLQEAYDTYKSAATSDMLSAAKELLAEIDDALFAQMENKDVKALIDKASVYTGMLSAVDRSDYLPAVDGATAEAPVDVTAVIINPTFDTIGDFTGWNGTAFGAGGTTSTNAEHYNKTYNTYQDIAGLRPGYYVAVVQGYYRHGSSTNDWALYNADDKSGQVQAYFYAISAVENKQVQVQYASECAMPSDSTWRQGVEAGNGLYIPNTMAQAKVWFDRETDTPENAFVSNKAYYNHCIVIYVDETGYLRIGVKKDSTINDNDWSIFDNFALFYTGSEEPNLATGIQTVDAGTATVALDGIYNLQGQKLAAPVKGINIIGGKKVLVK